MRVCFAMWAMCLVLRWMRESGTCGAALGRARSWLWGIRWLRLLGRWMKGGGMGDGIELESGVCSKGCVMIQ